MMKKYIFLIFFCALLVSNINHAQTYKNLVNEDFGSATANPSTSPATNILPGTTVYNVYTQARYVDDTYYAVINNLNPFSYYDNNTAGKNKVWQNGPDHTSGDGLGYMMLINANYLKRGELDGKYYQYSTAAFDIPGAEYIVDFWSANILTYNTTTTGGGLATDYKPGYIGLAVRNTIDGSGTLFAGNNWTLPRVATNSETFNNASPKYNNIPWVKNSLSFSLPLSYTSATPLYFNFYNSDPRDPSMACNTCGNDLVVDDINIRMRVVPFSGRVYQDANSNGIIDAGETGINGITTPLYVYVTKANGTIVSKTQVAVDGSYQLTTDMGVPYAGSDIGLKLVMSSISLNMGDNITNSTPPAGYSNVSETINSTYTTYGTSTTDALLNIVKSDATVSNINFGIQSNCVIPIVTTTPVTCVAAGTATLTNYNVNQTYTFSPSGPTIGAGGVISNFVVGTTYTLSTAGSATTSCTLPGSTTFTVLPNVTPCPVDISVTKTDNITKYKRPSTNTYTITVQNNSAIAVNGITLTDPLPANFGNSNDMEVTVITPSPGSTTSITVGSKGAINGTVNLPANGSIVFKVTLRINAFYPASDTNPNTNLPKTIINTATVTVPSGVIDSNSANNSSTDTDNPGIDARNDGYNDPIFTNLSGGNLGVVTINDELGGNLITNPATQVNITLIDNGGITGAAIAADGTLSIPNGVAAGVYILKYTICDKADLLDCDQATITLEIYQDSDKDGYADVIDLDDDNDGILDTVEDSACTTSTIYFNETFGTGARASSPYTNYTYVPNYYNSAAPNSADNVNDGMYALVNTLNNTAQWAYCAWVDNLSDHTGGGNGLMALFNASYNVSEEFYNRPNIAVPANIPVKLSFWAMNADRINFTCIAGGANRVKPNVRVEIQNNAGTVLKSFTTGLIPRDEQWHQYSVYFNPGANTSVRIVLKNDSEGGAGNDLVLDDIQIKSICDTDGDGTPNELDLDSDNDGCFDALEGDENVTKSQLNADGSINITANGGVGVTSGTNLGVPNLVNSGGTADVGGDVGQGSGSAYNVAVSACYIDAVNDINQTPINTPVNGNVVTNDESVGVITFQSAQYYNSAGVLTNLPLGTSTQVYTSAGTLAGSMNLNTSGIYTFTPATGFIGEVPLNYTASNEAGITDTAQLVIQVIPSPNTILNDKPIAQDDTAFTKAGVPVTSKALANDSDPDGNALTVTGAQGGTVITIGGPAVTVSGIDANGNPVANAGTITIAADGTYVFTPAVTFVGGTINPISYTISDGNGGTDTANIYITVNSNSTSLNYTYANDDANTAPKGVTMTGNVKANDTDPEGNTQTVKDATVNGTSLTIGTATSIPGVGTITLNTDGTYTFVPTATYVGTTSVVYTICDNGTPQACDQATLYLTSLDIVEGYCYKLPNINAGVTIPTRHGITALSRAGADNGNWPTVRQSSWTALEAKTKGFVVNRVAFDASGNPVGIATGNYVEGMMVYDTTNNCLKIYNGTIWSCYSTPTCP